MRGEPNVSSRAMERSSETVGTYPVRRKLEGDITV